MKKKFLPLMRKSASLNINFSLKFGTSFRKAASQMQLTAIALAELDVLLSLAEIAAERNYCCPDVINDPELKIIDGRHPVLDIIEPEGTFIPNDSVAGADEGMVLLITGPNMAGKAAPTFAKQSLICLMAQIGSFVPAKSAVVGIADRIFARVGASDELSRGQSTFMVEMTETARILNTATNAKSCDSG